MIRVRHGVLPVFLFLLQLAGVPYLSPAAAQNVPQPAPKPGRFLVAGRRMGDPRFARSVILMVRYEDEGALGLIINKPSEITLAKLLPEMAGLKTPNDLVYRGGPVARDGMMFLLRSESMPEQAQHVFADIYVSPSRKLFDKMVVEDDVRLRSYIGYAGWAAGQLESELRREDWHVVPADPDTVFTERPDTLWKTLIEQTEVLFARVLPRLPPPMHARPRL